MTQVTQHSHQLQLQPELHGNCATEAKGYTPVASLGLNVLSQDGYCGNCNFETRYAYSMSGAVYNGVQLVFKGSELSCVEFKEDLIDLGIDLVQKGDIEAKCAALLNQNVGSWFVAENDDDNFQYYVYAKVINQDGAEEIQRRPGTRTNSAWTNCSPAQFRSVEDLAKHTVACASYQVVTC